MYNNFNVVQYQFFILLLYDRKNGLNAHSVLSMDYIAVDFFNLDFTNLNNKTLNINITIYRYNTYMLRIKQDI